MKLAIPAVQFSTRGVAIVFVGLFLLVLLISTLWIDGVSWMMGSSNSNLNSVTQPPPSPRPSKPPPTPISFDCPGGLEIKVNCSRTAATPPPPRTTAATGSSPSCPEYFRYIHEDLRPWRATGLTREVVESARPFAHFRLVVLDGRAYILRYSRCFQTRDLYSLWGIVQLLARYPGRVPDLDLMFNCGDFPTIRRSDDPSAPPPPPLFRYCKDKDTVDIMFPDWSFWGWPEVNLKPWEPVLKEMKKGNEVAKWEDREPYAYWKGNPDVAQIRKELMMCNVSYGQEWNARLFSVNWISQIGNHFKGVDVASQCFYRYKIYIEGSAWSVSEKYILACDSPMLLVKTPFIDFFTRGLIPGRHYWPIHRDHKCESIKFAVDWGNTHPNEARTMGKQGGEFAHEGLKMDNVYDYMLHLLVEYAKLLRYKPSLPENATELCQESMACAATPWLERPFMMDSMVWSVHDSEPCTLPPPFGDGELQEISRTSDEFIKQVEMWEQEALQN